jgi:lipopolysaccharide export system permease protein
LNILNRYILKEFTQLLGLVLASLGSIYLIVEFIERVDDFVEHDAALVDSLLYFLYKLPLVIYQIMPMALLFPSILLVNRWIRSKELMAVKASGVSLFRFMRPIIMMSVLASAFVFLWGDFVVGPSLDRLDYIFREKIKKEASKEYLQRNIWVKTGDGEIWHISKFIPSESRMVGVVIYSFTSGQKIKTRVDAKGVSRKEGRWYFHETYVRSFVKGQMITSRYFKKVSLPYNLNLSDIKTEPIKLEGISLRRLWRKVKDRKAMGLDSAAMTVGMHSKLSYPLAGLVMALLGIPFSLSQERGGKAALSIIMGVAIGVFYWLIYFAGIAMGHAGLLPPIPAAWGANILFTLTGFYMILGARQ